MQEATIREHLRSVIESGDDRLLNILFAVAAAYHSATWPPEVIDEFKRRTSSPNTGVSRAHSWADTKDIITGQDPML